MQREIVFSWDISDSQPLHSQNTCEGDAGRPATFAYCRMGYGYETGRVRRVDNIRGWNWPR